MTEQDVLVLKIYVLLSPFLVLAMALFVVWLTGWMDRREQARRKLREEVAALAEE